MSPIIDTVPTTIVPIRPGPLRETTPSAEYQAARIFGAPEIGLALIGVLLLVAVPVTGLTWLVIPAIGCLGMGLGLPAQAALSRAKVAGAGVPIDVSHESTRRLVAAYQRVAGDRAALVAAHRILMEVADHLDGRPPNGQADIDYVTRRANAISDLEQGY